MAEKKDPQKTVSWSGTQGYHGRISERRKPYSCPRSEWPLLAEEMYTENTFVATVIDAISDTCLSARFSFEPGNPDDALSVSLAEQLNINMGLDGQGGRMKRSFEQIMRQILLYIPVGFRYFEVEWIYNEKEDMWDIYDLKDCKPSAHDRWIVKTEDAPTELQGDLEGLPRGALRGVYQKYASGDFAPEESGQPFIPSWSLLLFTHGQEGDNYEGRGLLRAVERSYHRYNEAELKLQSFLRGRPTVVMKINDKEMVSSSGCEMPDIMTQITDVRNSAMQFQLGQAALIETWPGVDITDTLLLDHQPEMAMSIREEASNEILLRGYVQFLQLGTTDTGSRAVGEVHESFFRRSCINILDYVCSIFNGDWQPMRGLVGQYAYYNAPVDVIDSALLPKLVHKGLQVDPVYENLDRIMNAFNSGLLIKTTDDEEQLRTLLGLKQKTVKAERDILEDQSGEEEVDNSQPRVE